MTPSTARGEIHNHCAYHHRNHWLILAIGCGVAMLFLMVWAWQDFDFVSQQERLVRLGLMLGFALAGGGQIERGTN